MTLSVGDALPQGQILKATEAGPETLDLADLGRGRVAIFGLPGAFTGTCTNAHMPSFVRNADALRAKGVDRILCLTVNDPFVAAAWARETGAFDAGIELLADADASLTKALGMEFTAPGVGLHDRCRRFSALIEDGKFTRVNLEESAGQCSISAGEALLAQV